MIQFDILQIDLEKEIRGELNYAFIDSEFLVTNTKQLFPPPADLYQKVYTDHQERIAPEEVFRKFNIAHPQDYRGRSLSISDVIRYHLRNGQLLHLFCDTVGFRAIDFGDEYKIATAPRYFPGSENKHAMVILYYQNGDKNRIVNVDVPLLFEGKAVACDQSGQEVELTAAEIYTAIQTAIAYQRKSSSNKEEQAIPTPNLIDIFEKFI